MDIHQEGRIRAAANDDTGDADFFVGIFRDGLEENGDWRLPFVLTYREQIRILLEDVNALHFPNGSLGPLFQREARDRLTAMMQFDAVDKIPRVHRLLGHDVRYHAMNMASHLPSDCETVRLLGDIQQRCAAIAASLRTLLNMHVEKNDPRLLAHTRTLFGDRSARARKTLMRLEVFAAPLWQLESCTVQDVLAIQNCGPKTATEIANHMQIHGLSFGKELDGLAMAK